MTYRIWNASNQSEQSNQGIPISSNPIRLATKYSDQIIRIGSIGATGPATQRDSSTSRVMTTSSLVQNSKPAPIPSISQTVSTNMNVNQSKQIVQDTVKIEQKLNETICKQIPSVIQNYSTSANRSQLPVINSEKSSYVQIVSENKLNPEYGSTVKKQQAFKLQYETPTREQQSRRMTTEPSYGYGPIKSAHGYNYRTIGQGQGSKQTNRITSDFTPNTQDYSNQTVLPPRQVTPAKEVIMTPKKQLDAGWIKQKIELDERIQELSQKNAKINEQKEEMKVRLEQDKLNFRFLQDKSAKIESEYIECQNRQDSLRQKVMMLERQIISTKSKGKAQQHFEDVLKHQLEQTQKFKEIIEEKSEEIARLHQQINANRRSTEEAINDANVQKLKCITEKKAWEQLQDITMLNKDNEIKRLKHALETMESKLQVAIKQNKTKDQFIQQHLVGRAKTIEEKDYINQILSKYETELGVSKLSHKLLEEQQEIERLQSLLNKQGHY